MIRFLSMAKSYLPISVKEFFMCPTVSELVSSFAQQIDQMTNNIVSNNVLPQLHEFPLSLQFHENYIADTPNVIKVDLKNVTLISPSQFETIVQQLLWHHDVLRTVFSASPSPELSYSSSINSRKSMAIYYRPIIKAIDSIKFTPHQFIDLCNLPSKDLFLQKKIIRREIIKLQRSLDPVQGPMLRAVTFLMNIENTYYSDCDNNNICYYYYCIALIVHPLIADEHSLRILQSDS